MISLPQTLFLCFISFGFGAAFAFYVWRDERSAVRREAFGDARVAVMRGFSPARNTQAELSRNLGLLAAAQIIDRLRDEEDGATMFVGSADAGAPLPRDEIQSPRPPRR